MSQSVEYYDPDDVLPNRTPPLVPSKLNFQSEETPPPLVAVDSSPSSSSPDSVAGPPALGKTGAVRRRVQRVSSRAKGRKGHTQPTQSDAVLIRSLAPNYPEVAAHAAQEPLNSASQSEAEESDADFMSDAEKSRHDTSHVDTDVRDRLAVVASNANDILARRDEEDSPEDFEMIEKPQKVRLKEERSPDEPMYNGFHESDSNAMQAELTPLETKSSPHKSAFDLKPPPLNPLKPSPVINTDIARFRHDRNFDDDEGLASPRLRKFAISSAEGNPDSTLPAIHKSPPESSSAHSPDNHQKLPSIQALALNMDAAVSSHYSNTVQSPSMTRPSPGHVSQFGPSPSSYSQPSPQMSPPGIPSHPSYWRSAAREGSISTSTPSDYLSTPSSSVTNSSSYATPTAAVLETSQNGDGSSGSDDTTSAGQPPQQQPGGGASLNGTATNSGSGFPPHTFKCSYPGCTAVPFQTQYLLNSHANVHSSNRPHFCPVKGCNRGPDGKGFKRKNEMIRHGLVHDSPGYVCPFCPDQQHKYPRPDNLQRHVRVHHMNKDRDDPALRQVLAQRPEGGNRGRRRRGGSS